MSSSQPLTDPEFWDRFWGNVRLPAFPDASRRYERCFLEIFERFFKPDPGLRVFEAGCAPGAWLSYFSRHFGYQAYGCDTSPRGVELTRENFRLCGIAGTVVQTEFLDVPGEGTFDVVLSLGFIEHFADPGPVLDKHVRLLKPGGVLVLEVPNLVGLNAWLVTPELLAVHNQTVMNRLFFEDFGRSRGLETLFLGYIGGFEPDNLGPPRPALLRRVVLKALRILRALPGTGKLNSVLFSGFLIGLYRKPREVR
ncbi:MAG: class I SAM-dependent methyltransferase [Elusimicrobiota bacterium]